MILRRETLDDILDRISEQYEAGEVDRAHKELRRARRMHPEDLTLREWEATFANDEGRFEEALAHIESVLAVQPERDFSRRERTTSLLGLGRFPEALALLESLRERLESDASYHYDVGVCLDHLGRTRDADRSLSQASALDPEGCPSPLRLDRKAFGRLVEEGLEQVPEELKPYLLNVTVEVFDYPQSPPLDPGFAPDLLGLYVGVPRTERSEATADNLDRIYIFKRNLELTFPERDTLREEVRKTVIHEIAHHFGIDEEDMGEYA